MRGPIAGDWRLDRPAAGDASPAAERENGPVSGHIDQMVSYLRVVPSTWKLFTPGLARGVLMDEPENSAPHKRPRLTDSLGLGRMRNGLRRNALDRRESSHVA